MTFDEARRASVLAEAYSDLADVREGLTKAEPDQIIWLSLVALDGDREGGCHEGCSLIPADLGPKILDRIKDVLGDELVRLGVDVPLDAGVSEDDGGQNA